MLDSQSDYVQIRDTMFGDGPRVAIDANVLGIRDLNRIKRNVDQYYLKEIKSLYETNNLDNSIEFKYPIPATELLPIPTLSYYADKDKFEKLKTDILDMWIYTGGDDPDEERLRERYQKLTDDHHDALSSLDKDKNDTLSTLYDTLSSDLKKNEDSLSSLEDTLSTIYEAYYDEVAKQLSDYQDDLSSLDLKKIDIDRQRLEGSIELSVWAERRQDLEYEYYDLHFDNFKQNGAIDSKFYGNLAEYYDEHYELVLEKLNILNKYEKDVANALSTYNRDLSSENYNFNVEANDIFLESNGYIGLKFSENGEKLKLDISELSVYNAHTNIKKKIPWISSKNATKFVEYNDRLFADWEKCILLKASASLGLVPWTVSFRKDVEGVMEHYTSYANYDSVEMEGVTVPGGQWHDDFDRWLGGNMVAYKIEYEPGEGAGQQSTIKIISLTFTARFGNRHMLDKIKKLYLILYADGAGEEYGTGRMYKLVEAKYDRILAESWLKKIDDEDDLNLQNLQQLEDDYNEANTDLLFEQEEEEYELEIDYQKDLLEIDEQLTLQIRSRTAGWIGGIESVMSLANSMKAAGEDNSELLRLISESKSNYIELVNLLRLSAQDRKDRLRDKNREDKRAIINKYSDLHSDLTDKWREDKEEEETRHREANKKIWDDYYEDFSQQNDKIWNDYDEAVLAAADERQKAWDDMNELDEQFNKDMADKWNDYFKDDPYYEEEWKVGEDFPFAGGNIPRQASPGSTENKWIASAIWSPSVSHSIANGHQNETLHDKYLTAVAKAEQEREEALGKLESLDTNARYAFTFSGSAFADFIGEFEAGHLHSEIGIASVDSISLVAAFAEMDYGANTGKEYKNYELEDLAKEEDTSNN